MHSEISSYMHFQSKQTVYKVKLCIHVLIHNVRFYTHYYYYITGYIQKHNDLLVHRRLHQIIFRQIDDFMFIKKKPNRNTYSNLHGRLIQSCSSLQVDKKKYEYTEYQVKLL